MTESSELTYEVVARNFSEASENRIHSDEIAKKYGFRGALVPGVAVYGHLTHPLVEKFGESWLKSSTDRLRLLKPAYHEDRLLLTLAQDSDGTQAVRCFNQDGELLATLDSDVGVPSRAVDDYEAMLGAQFKNPERIEIAWDSVTPGEAFIPWDVTLTQELSGTYQSQVADEQPIYSSCVHPHLLLSLANTALTNEYIMPTWIHVGSETRHRQTLRIGDTITIKSVVVDRWERKGHQFIKLWVSYWRDGELTTDIEHTAIFRVAP